MGYGRARFSRRPRIPLGVPDPRHLLDAGRILVHYVAMQEGGYDKLKGKKIAFIYHDSPVRQGTDPGVPGAVQAARLRAGDVPVTPPGPGAEVDLAAAAASSGPIGRSCGAGG